MEHLFRMMLARPAIAQDPKNPSIDLTQDSRFQQELRTVVASGRDVRSGIEAVSAAFIRSHGFIGEPERNPLANELAQLAEGLDTLEAHLTLTPKKLGDLVKTVSGETVAKFAKSDRFEQAAASLRDSLVAIKVLQEEHTRPIEALTQQLRTMELVLRAAGDAGFPTDGAQLRRARRRSLRLPMLMGLKSRLSTKDAEKENRRKREEAVDSRRKQVEALLEKKTRLQGALKELTTLPSTAFRETVQSASAEMLPPQNLRMASVQGEKAEFTQTLRGMNLEQLKRLGEARGDERGESAATSRALTTTDLAKTLMQATQVALPGRQEFVPTSLTDIGFVLAPSAGKSLSKGTQALLSEHAVDLGALPLNKATERLEGELLETLSTLENVAGRAVRQSFLRIGDALVSIQTPMAVDWGITHVVPLQALDGRVPQTRGAVAPAGIADLLVVKQQLVGYEAADVAHIENVLKGERKLREHTRRDEMQVISLEESEVSTSEERELESTSRFEMTREASETIKEDVALKAGLKISGKYGPVVEFSASAEGSYARSKEEATKSASKFSQDVTERSSRKIAERVLKRTQVTVTNETTEKNSHEINNVPGTGHVAGVYQWVNKVYEAQMFNYGLRTLFDFMVPEPASFLIAAMNQAHGSAMSLVKPPDFTLTPAQVSESNYAYWTRLTQATDVSPPPERYRTKSAEFKAGGGDDKANYNHAGQIAIDDGYRATFGSVARVCNIWDNTAALDVVLGRRTQRLGTGSWLWTTSLDDEQDSIPFALDSFRMSQVAVAIEVVCQRTERAMEKWRFDTWGKLATAHKALMSEYEDKLAALKMQAGIAIQGRNPAANLITIEAELKKNCVSILTDQHFDLFNAIDNSPSNGLPQIDVFEAAGEGAYVRFFEQAFEWEHMTYVTYPYFWGRKSQWDERVGFDDPDPVFADFLRAGYCRVSVPARPGFEGAIDHFLTFGETWNGGPLPAISNPLYLPIADEIAERLDQPGDEIAQGDPWTVRIPTRLVKLRADDQLPQWQKNAAGEWVEA